MLGNHITAFNLIDVNDPLEMGSPELLTPADSDVDSNPVLAVI